MIDYIKVTITKFHKFQEEEIIKVKKGNIILVIILILLSISIYYIQNQIFHQEENTIFYLFQDLAFVPIQVLLVTLLLNRFLNLMETRKKTKKINVIISTFFVEAGTEILSNMSDLNQNNEDLYYLLQQSDEDNIKTRSLRKKLLDFDYEMHIEQNRLIQLSETLNKYREFMLNMLGNDNLLEHDSFTDMLWAVFHVADELQMRLGVCSLLEEDINHLTIDMKRAYSAVVYEWANYMSYLKSEYPFLYVIALKKAKGIFIE